MPIYDYACTACGQVTEVIHGIDAPGPRFCPACGTEGSLRKAIATPAVHFKGSGWAKKDRSSSRAPTKTGDSTGGDAGDGAAKGAEAPAAARSGNGETSKDKRADAGAGSGGSAAATPAKGTAAGARSED